ncbi:AraC family transcriptional regulator [Rathayibacter caricis]|uniref:AraC family transcriptional regulator n=1 Tax=Rathayibacter caricis TaxID=110936 RepID=UPI001FB2BE32|nr:AraC family transcriptional regulator [Rathayibacter caricis]MCJ1697342.1 AraC family transcriptional regulator [Rathayibacter caricis]
MRFSSYQSVRVPNFSIHVLRDVLEEAGLDWRAALRGAEIDPDAVDRLGGTIPARKELAFQLEFVELTRDRVDLWLRAARGYGPGSFSIRGLAFVSAPTIEAWVEAGATDDAPALLEAAPLRTADGELTGLELTYPDAPPGLIPFSVYRELSVTVRTFSWLYGAPFPFTHVEFPLPDVAPEAAGMIDGPIVAGSDAYRIWWEPSASTAQLPFGNDFQYATWVKRDTLVLETLRRTGDWPATVEKVIRTAPHLNRKLANVAAALRVSPRTLQRKLESTGHDFARLRDATLADIAAQLLSTTDESVTQISRTLGYAEPASFTGAFRKWKGTSPSSFREASR